MTTTAKILAKGTKGTGLEEDLAKKLYDQLGSKVLAIVEIVSDKRGDDRSGNEHVDLQILSIEPVVEDAEDHVRGLQRAMFMNRKLHSTDAQPTLDSVDDVEPKVEEVMAKGIQFTPHDFESAGRGDDGKWLNECNVCGAGDDAPLHAGDQANGLFQEPVVDGEHDAEDDDLTNLPHEASPSPEDESLCFLCDQHVDDNIHVTADDREEVTA